MRTDLIYGWMGGEGDETPREERMKAFRVTTFIAVIALFVGLVAASDALAGENQKGRIIEAISKDPVAFDPQYPAAYLERAIPSHGDRMFTMVYMAQGKGPHPTVLLLHGFPGGDCNSDLAPIFRRAGWNCVWFHYRGFEGSEGTYSSFTMLVEDVAEALKFLREEKKAAEWRIDSRRIVLVGHSFGGAVALAAAAQDPEIRSVVSIAAYNPVWTARRAKDPEIAKGIAAWLDQEKFMIRKIPGEALVQQALAKGESLDMLQGVPALCTKSLLLIGARRDEMAPLDKHHEPLVRALREQKASNLSEIMLDTDHNFSDRRIALAEALLSWLEEQR